MVPLTNLRHLSFFGIEGASQIGLEGLQRLGASPSLKNLSISSEKIDDAAMKLIADQYPNLTSVTLWHSTITDNGVSDLIRLRKLTHLDLGGAIQFTSTGVNRILDLPDLWRLSLSTPDLPPEVLVKLFNHPKLGYISLGSERLDETSFAPLLNTEGRSGHLDISPKAMSFKLAKQIKQRHPNFRINRGDIVRRDIAQWVLDAGGTMTLTVKGNSRPVTLKKGDALPEDDFEAIKGDVTGLPGGNILLKPLEANGPGLLELEEAILTDTDTPGNILMQIGSFPKLTKLDVVGIKVTDVHIDRMPVMPNLKTLDLRRTEITAEGALRLAARMPQLKIGVDDAIQEKIKQLQRKKK